MIEVDGHITGFTQTDISFDYLSIAGQYSWFIGKKKKRDEEHYEFSIKIVWYFCPSRGVIYVIWNKIKNHRC